MSKNKATGYSLLEEISHSTTHGIGTLLGIAMLVVLLVFSVRSGTLVTWKVVSSAIYGTSIILLYTMSALYHAITNQRAKRILKICDHTAIYFLIAGSYTPFALVTLRPTHPALAWSIFGVIWGMTLAGTIFKPFTAGRFRLFSTLSYIAMGWVVVIAVKPLLRLLPMPGFLWLLAGGILYTLGTIFYMWRSLPFHHAIWHLFVLGGTICQFFCILLYVIMP